MLNIFGKVKCDVCNKQIGFFENYDEEFDVKGNKLIVCLKCRDDLWNEKKKIRNQEIKEILGKYYDVSDIYKKSVLSALHSMENIRSQFKNESMDLIIEKFNEINSQNNSDVDNKKLCDVMLVIVKDMQKLKKIIKKKDIEISYIEMMDFFGFCGREELEHNVEKTIDTEYFRIKRLLSNEETNVENIIKEFLRSPIIQEKDEFTVGKIIKKFNVDFQDDELSLIFGQIKEDVELEDFGKNMGGDDKKSRLDDYLELSGYDFEAFLKKLFEALEYIVVQTKLSGDQGADLIVMDKRNRKIAVQAKKYSSGVSNKAIQEVVASKSYYKCDDAMVVTTGFFTKGAIELAMSNNVEIWNGEKLREMFEKINSENIEGISKIVNDSDFLYCPLCNYEIKNYLHNKDSGEIVEEDSFICPQCKIKIDIKGSYLCNGCKNKISIPEWRNHLENCQQVKERMFICPECSQEIFLEDWEFDNLRKSGEVSTQCPYDECEKNIIMNKNNSKYFSN